MHVILVNVSQMYVVIYIPVCYFLCFALYVCTHWSHGVIMAPALSLLASPEVVMITPSGVGWWQDRRCGGPQSSVKSGCGDNLPTQLCYMLPCMCMHGCMFIDNKKRIPVIHNNTYIHMLAHGMPIVRYNANHVRYLIRGLPKKCKLVATSEESICIIPYSLSLSMVIVGIRT